MGIPTTGIGFSPSTPAADNGFQNAVPRGDGGTPLMRESFEVPNTGGANPQTSNYAAVAADCGKIIVFNSAGAVTLTLPSAIPFGQWEIGVQNIGVGTLTVAPGGSTQIDGAGSSLTLAQNTGLQIQTDGTNYFTVRGASSYTAPSGSANKVYATPNGSSGAASLRALVSADLPVGSATQLGAVEVDGTSIVAVAGVISTAGATAIKAVYTGNSASGGVTSGTTATSGAFATTKGNAVIVFVAGSAATAPSSVTDTQGNTYALVASETTGAQQYVYLALNVAGGSGNAVTVTYGFSVTFGFEAMEYANVVGVSAFDAFGSNVGSLSGLTASVTTTNPSDVLIACGFVSGGSGFTYGWSSGFTQQIAAVPVGTVNLSIADQNVTSAGSKSATFTASGSGGPTVSLMIVALRVSTGVLDVNGLPGHVVLAGTSIPAFGASGTGHAQGAVPDPGVTAGATRYLREDKTWDVPPGGASGGLFSALITSTPTLSGTGLTTALSANSGYTGANVATGILLSDTTSVTNTDHIEGQVGTYPTAPFTLYALISVPFTTGVNIHFGLAIASSTSGKALTFSLRNGQTSGYTTTPIWNPWVKEWSSPTSGGTDILNTTTQVFAGQFVWLVLRDDGTNITFYISSDGIFLRQLWTSTKSSSWLGSGGFSLIGLAMNPYNNNSAGLGFVCMNWLITNP